MVVGVLALLDLPDLDRVGADVVGAQVGRGVGGGVGGLVGGSVGCLTARKKERETDIN